MQIKLMLLLLSFLIGDRLIDSGGSRPSDKEGGRGGLVIQTLRYGGGPGALAPPRGLPLVEGRLIGVWLYNEAECSRSSPCDRKSRKAESGIGRNGNRNSDLKGTDTRTGTSFTLSWLNTVLRAVSGNSLDGGCFKLEKQTSRWKNNGTQKTIC